MSTPNQAWIIQAKKRLHKARIDLGLSMTELARRADHPRESVSRAVNKGMHPRVLKKVEEVLGV